MGLVLAPLKADKLEAWKSWSRSLTGEQSGEFEDFNKRYELTRHEAWLAETPNGPLVVAIHDGPGAETFMAKIVESEHSFDVAFKEKLMELHGMDLAAPPPGPPPVRMI